jgi:predicted nucleic acid-binding protein
VKPVLVDASFLIALYNKDDINHARCVRFLNEFDAPLVTCEAVLAESLHMLRFVHGAARSILASLESGALEIRFDLAQSAAAIRATLEKYRDTPADLADACLIHMADQLDTSDILTLDSDFRHYRWRRNRQFRMLIPTA